MEFKNLVTVGVFALLCCIVLTIPKWFHARPEPQSTTSTDRRYSDKEQMTVEVFSADLAIGKPNGPSTITLPVIPILKNIPCKVSIDPEFDVFDEIEMTISQDGTKTVTVYDDDFDFTLTATNDSYPYITLRFVDETKDPAEELPEEGIEIKVRISQDLRVQELLSHVSNSGANTQSKITKP
ncbi:MAG: hypothetical protein R3B84_20865 [Zavarzinella sp.]